MMPTSSSRARDGACAVAGPRQAPLLSWLLSTPMPAGPATGLLRGEPGCGHLTPERPQRQVSPRAAFEHCAARRGGDSPAGIPLPPEEPEVGKHLRGSVDQFGSSLDSVGCLGYHPA